MATTSPDNIKTPDAGDQYALVQDLGAMADTVQNALTRRANSFVGTSAQRTSFSGSALEGTSWRDTDGSKLGFVFQSGSWVPVSGVSGATDITSSLSTAYRGTLNGRTVDSQKRISYSGGGTGVFASNSSQVIGTLPAAWRPREQTQWFVRLSGGYLGTLILNPGGEMTVYNFSGSNRSAAWFEVTFI